MNRVLSLNTAAVAALALADVPRMRVRTVDGILQVRPTDRINTSNIPAGEVLADVRGSKVTIPAEMLYGMNSNGKLELVSGSHYGWMTFKAAAALPRGTAGASIN